MLAAVALVAGACRTGPGDTDPGTGIRDGGPTAPRATNRVASTTAAPPRPPSDTTTLYVVVYDANTLLKLATDGLRVLQRLPTGTHPIGVTVEPVAHRLWVAVHIGAILVFDEA